MKQPNISCSPFVGKLNTIRRMALILLKKKIKVWRYLFGQIVEAIGQTVREIKSVKKPLVIFSFVAANRLLSV